MGLRILPPPVHRASGVNDVGKHARGTEEYIVVARHPGVEAHVVLYFHVFAQAYTGRYHHVLSDVAAVAEFGFGHDVREMPDFDAGSDVRAWVDHCGGVDECRFVNHAEKYKSLRNAAAGGRWRFEGAAEVLGAEPAVTPLGDEAVEALGHGSWK